MSNDMPTPRKVVVDFTIRMITNEYYNKDEIEFRYNESSWCADSLLDNINYWKEKTGSCICGLTTAKYIREASEEDIENFEKGCLEQ
jgi:hypothetical protein